MNFDQNNCINPLTGQQVGALEYLFIIPNTYIVKLVLFWYKNFIILEMFGDELFHIHTGCIFKSMSIKNLI